LGALIKRRGLVGQLVREHTPLLLLLLTHLEIIAQCLSAFMLVDLVFEHPWLLNDK
jgi:hypothetical protein